MSDIDIAGLEGFELVEAGGFGLVYRARQPRFERTVAVKVLQTRITDDRLQHQFRRECAAAGRLTGHPHIVTVFDAGFTSEGRPYLVMEWMEGGSLEDHLRAKGPLGPRAVVTVGAKVAGALAAAHAEGVLHRDVKPANILVSRYGEPELGDFGIASLGPATGMSVSMYALTPVHAAPEVLEGSRATTASDVYSLASTLWTLLSGEAPFAGPPDEAVVPMVMRILRSEPPTLERPGIPAELVDVLTGAMAKVPAERPASAAEFAAALLASLEASPAPAPRPQARAAATRSPVPANVLAPVPPSPPMRAAAADTEVVAPPPRPRGHRGRRVAIWSASAATLLVLAAGVGFTLWSRGGAAGPATTQRPPPSWPPAVGACINDTDPAPNSYEPVVVSCDDPHVSEVAATFLVSTQGDKYPGVEALSAGSYKSPCTTDVYDRYLHAPVSTRTDLVATEIQPDEKSWAGGKAMFICVLEHPDQAKTTGKLGG